MALEERSVPAALVTAHRSGLLRHVQLSDSNRLAPGWGFLNWADIFATLDALDYDRWICIEALQSPESEAVAMQGHRLATAMGRHDDD
jgi:D-psicose/D-tagatose/L-ribulose 3-epimerase